MKISKQKLRETRQRYVKTAPKSNWQIANSPHVDIRRTIAVYSVVELPDHEVRLPGDALFKQMVNEVRQLKRLGKNLEQIYVYEYVFLYNTNEWWKNERAHDKTRLTTISTSWTTSNDCPSKRHFRRK